MGRITSLAFAALAACATAPTAPSEPAASSAVASGSATPAASAMPAGSAAPAGDAAPPVSAPAPADARVEFGDDWLASRAKTLGLSVEAARARDRELGSNHPPAPQFWDEQMALQSASTWRLICNECHPGRRGIGSATAIPPPPPGWGEGLGKIFGRSRRYADTYDIIAGGVASTRSTSMPGFEDKLSREQIWGLIRFLEQASSPGSR